MKPPTKLNAETLPDLLKAGGDLAHLDLPSPVLDHIRRLESALRAVIQREGEASQTVARLIGDDDSWEDAGGKNVGKELQNWVAAVSPDTPGVVTLHPLTIEEVGVIYGDVVPDTNFSEQDADWQEDVAKEVNAVLSAETAVAAAGKIAWWQGGKGFDDSEANRVSLCLARDFRRLAVKHFPEKCRAAVAA